MMRSKINLIRFLEISCQIRIFIEFLLGPSVPEIREAVAGWCFVCVVEIFPARIESDLCDVRCGAGPDAVDSLAGDTAFEMH